MANVIVANNTPELQGNHLITAEVGNPNITGLLAFNRAGGAAPFSVNAGSAMVANLYADRARVADTATNAANGAQPLVAIPFNPADYTLDSGTWAPTVLGNLYTKVGPLIYWTFAANPCTLSAASGNLFIRNLPFGLTSNVAFGAVAHSPVRAYVQAVGPNTVAIIRSDGTNWSGSAFIYFSVTLPGA